MGSLPLAYQLAIFLLSAVVTWLAGVTLTKTTDSLDCRFKIGEALGGLIFLGIAASLPEIAICYSAAINGHIPVIIGNLIGGISIQTLVIVVLDLATKGKKPLSYLAGSMTLFFETIFAIIITALAIAGTFVPVKNTIFHINPFSIIIVIAWIVGLFLINRAHRIARFNETAEDATAGRLHDQCRVSDTNPFYKGKSSLYVILIFIFASLITLIAGFLLEETGTAIAGQLGIGSGIFAATVLAFITSLPEISTGLESIAIGDNHMAISDILGGNAFMLVIFFMADLIMQKPTLSYAGNNDRLFAVLGLGLMGVYAVSFLKKLQRRYWHMGLDSVLEIIIYAFGIVALVYFR
jgi:cation:H+ antiporter